MKTEAEVKAMLEKYERSAKSAQDAKHPPRTPVTVYASISILEWVLELNENKKGEN
jgi:hypothetical protein